MSGLTVARADPADPQVAALIAAHVANSEALYPAESSHALDPATLDAAGIALFAGWQSGRAVVIGGLKPLSGGAAEVKSMHTARDARGRGLGAAMLAHLIGAARAAGHDRLLLETGSDAGSAAARALYGAAGFVECPPFEGYRPDPLSVFLSLDL